MSRFRRLFHLRSNARDEVSAELEHHLELSTRQLMATGMSRDAARSEAERRLAAHGDAERRLYDAARSRDRRLKFRNHLDNVWTEVRLVIRGFRRQPALTALIAGTLALGIGANATVFPMVDRLLFRTPTGLANPGELRRLYVTTVQQDTLRMSPYISYPGAAEVKSLLAPRAELAMYGSSGITVGEDEVERRVSYVSANALPLLGVRIAKGRHFAPDDDVPPTVKPVAIISHDTWRTVFGSDPAIIGKRITFSNAISPVPAHEIIGVTQPGFTGIDLEPVHVWVPVATHVQALYSYRDPRVARDVLVEHGADQWRAILRVKTGDIRLLEHDATGALRRGRINTGLADRQMTAQFASIIEGRGPLPDTQEELIATRLAGVSLVLLLIALANATNLMLARATAREREIAVRKALGVSSGRLAVTFIVEALGIAAIAAVAATIFSAALGGVVRSLLLPDSNWTPSAVDPRAVGFTAALAVACALVAGLASAFRATRGDTTRFLRGGQSGAGARAPWVRNTLLAAQSAMSAVLLIGAMLFVVSLDRVANADLGYDIKRLTAVRARLTDSAMMGAMIPVADVLARRPDVAGVTVASSTPLRDVRTEGMFFEGNPARVFGSSAPSVIAVSAGFFETLRVAIVRGRGITSDDLRGSPRVIVVNEATVRTFWPGQDPIGKCVRLSRDTAPCHTVVGIAEPTNRGRIIEAPAAQVWIPLEQATGRLAQTSTMLLRTRGDGKEAVEFAMNELRAAGTSGRPPTAWPYAGWIGPQLRNWMLGAKLFGAISALALVLAVVGLYSVLSVSVAQRANEIGIRLALGATSRSVTALVVRQGLRVVAIGVVAGLVVAAGASRAIAALLYDTSPRDPIVYGAVAAVLLVAAAAAAFVPARRAGSLDPIAVLRRE